MLNIMSTIGLYNALKKQGYELPKECVDVDLKFPVNGAMRIVFFCNVDAEDLVKIGNALAEMGKERQ